MSFLFEKFIGFTLMVIDDKDILHLCKQYLYI